MSSAENKSSTSNGGTHDKKSKKWVVAISVVMGLMAMISVFQNCSKKGSSGGDSGASTKAAVSSEDKLMAMLEESLDISRQLELNFSQIKQINTTSSSPSGQIDATSLVLSIKSQHDLIESMIQKEGKATNSVEVLKEVDELVNLLASAKSTRAYQWSFLDNIFLELKLTEVIKKVGDELTSFKSVIEDRFKAIENRMGALENRAAVLNKTVSDLSTSTDKSIKDLTESLGHFKEVTQQDIAAVKARAVIFGQRVDTIEGNQKASSAAFDKLKSLQDRICSVNEETGEINDSRKRGGALVDAANTTCMTVDDINCKAFGTSDAEAQCNLMVQFLKSHDQQLKYIFKVEQSHSGSITEILNSLKQVREDLYGNETQKGLLVKVEQTILDINTLKEIASAAGASIVEIQKWQQKVDTDLAALNELKNKQTMVDNSDLLKDLELVTLGAGDMDDEVRTFFYDPIKDKLNNQGLLSKYLTLHVSRRNAVAMFSLNKQVTDKGGQFFVVDKRTGQEIGAGATIYLFFGDKYTSVLGADSYGDPSRSIIIGMGDNDNDALFAGYHAIHVKYLPSSKQSPKGVPTSCATSQTLTANLNVEIPKYFTGVAINCAERLANGLITIANMSNPVVFDNLPATAVGAADVYTSDNGYGIYRCEQKEVVGNEAQWYFYPCAK